MMRALFALLAVLSLPMIAWAAASQLVQPTDQTHPALAWAVALLQMYIASELPAMKKRILRIENTVRDFINGVVR